VGETLVFNNAVVRGFSLDIDELEIEINLPRSASGYASVRGPGYATKDSVRANACVSNL